MVHSVCLGRVRLRHALMLFMVFGAVLSAPAHGWAQAMSSEPTAAHPSGPRLELPLRLGGELAATSRSGLRDQVWVLSPVVGGSYRVTPVLDLEGAWGGVMVIDVGADGITAPTFGSSNLALGGRFWLHEDSTQELSASVELLPPLAWLGRDGLAGQRRAGFGLAAAMRGLWNPWRWAPEQTGGAVGVRYGRRFSPITRVQLEGGVGSTLSLGIGTADVAELYGQLAGDAIASEGPIDFGLRVQGVWMTADRAAMQLALSPYLAVHISSTLVRGQFLVNLDEPLGVFGDGMGVWAVLLAVETEL